MATGHKLKNGLVVYTKGAGTTVLDLQGTAGQLAKVDDEMTGLIHSVGDISGTPILEVYDDGRVYFNYDLILTGLPTSSAGLDPGTVWNDAGTLKIA